ncbi:hypothetical protein AJ78_01583 [Emergomyces pasteurianus Ep9510]|uniref:Protein kinase domain-containing protein n=1 Tax=Emergomyces pasteurianus Ep9510 TaxID=1447872 RepID=A0A1J9QDW8_9EURO|nr:hypothetical protein AJ78_01583 [Emergomyces pasteurianus Ep9510]
MVLMRENTPPVGILLRYAQAWNGALKFAEDGPWKPGIEIPQTSLKASEEFLSGKSKEMLLLFMRGMLQWRPQDRKTAKQPLEDPWLNDRID